MITTGLLSVTFRKLSPSEIVKLVSKAGLLAIEWGGDIHVPAGDAKTAVEVGSMTRDAGIEVASYGSYYRAGCTVSGDRQFERVLETAIGLKAPTVRVWAGNRGSESSDEAWWSQVVEDGARIADLAAKEELTIDFEYHGGTLTDSARSACRLLKEIDRPNVRSNWQTPVHETLEQRINGLLQIRPWLANIHVFHFLPGRRCPLIEGKDEWMRYMEIIRETGKKHYTMLEFVKDDDPEQFLRDAKSLLSIMNESF